MFSTLPESRATRTRRVGGTVTSILVHAALIAGAVSVTVGTVSGREPGDVPRHPDIIYIPAPVPAPSTAGVVSRGTTTAPPLQVDVDLPTMPRLDLVTTIPPVLDGGRAPDAGSEFTGHALAPASGGGIIGHGDGVGPGGVIGELEADRSPHVVGAAVEPRYPDGLRAAGITGRVVAQFVVDTLGRAEPASVEIIEATREEFAESVRAALPRMRFSAGEAAGHKVRTRVRIPFDFTLR